MFAYFTPKILRFTQDDGKMHKILRCCSELGVCVSLSFRGSETTEESRCVIFPGSFALLRMTVRCTRFFAVAQNWEFV